MRDFFLFETELPVGSGFQLFGPCHLTWLFSILLFIVINTKWYVRQTAKRQKKMNNLMGFLFPVIAVYRDMALVLTGHFNRGFLPFHLCSMALWIAFFYILTNNRFLGVVYVLLCVPGAMAALLFPNWEMYPLFNYMHIHGFISHGLIVAFGIWLLAAGKVKPDWKDYWMPVLFGMIGVMIIYPLNICLHTNFWFLAIPSQGSPLELIWRRTGSIWYIVGYLAFCMLVVALWQMVISLTRRSRNSG